MRKTKKTAKTAVAGDVIVSHDNLQVIMMQVEQQKIMKRLDGLADAVVRAHARIDANERTLCTHVKRMDHIVDGVDAQSQSFLKHMRDLHATSQKSDLQKAWDNVMSHNLSDKALDAIDALVEASLADPQSKR